MNLELAIIGGSGFEKVAGAEFVSQHALATPYGAPSAPIEIYRCADTTFLVLSRHGRPHCIAPHRINYRANLHALSEFGARGIIAINSVGGITGDALTGSIIIPDQIIDYTYGREHTFFSSEEALQHVDFSEPYSSVLRARLLRAAEEAGVAVIDGGVYGATQGPRLESKAEIGRLERDGCNIVGMTGMPEAALARELGIDYAALCIVVNAAAGKGNEPLSVGAMQAAMASAQIDIEKILRSFLRSKPHCINRVAVDY